MKKTLALLSILIVILFAFSACGDESSSTPSTNGTDDVDNRPPTQEVFIYSFSEYLDYMGFDENMWQGVLMDLLETFSYNGNGVLGNGHFSDGPYGGGFSGSSEACKYSNYYHSDGITANAINYIETTAPINGLTLPYGITFNNTLEDVIKAACPKFRGSLPSEGEVKNFSTTDNGTIHISKTDKSPSVFVLRYEEIYRVALIDERVSTVTRFIEFTFDEENKKLLKFKICVEESYPAKKIIVNSFHEYLDYMKYDETMSQQDFDSFLRQFLYDGETIIKNFYHGDGAGYSEYAGGCNNVYFKLRGEDFDEYTEYTKLFSTKAPLAGLTLPYGVTFDSTVEETLQVLGVSDVGALPTGEETITLVTNDNGTVTISRTENTTGSFYLVEYKESYQVSSNDKTDDVWRYVRFYFEQDSESLAKFELCMVRHHPE